MGLAYWYLFAYNPIMLHNVVAANVKALRSTRAWSQCDLASVSGVSRPVIAKLETGMLKSPRIQTLEKLAHAFGCHVTHLLIDYATDGAPRIKAAAGGR